MGVSTNTRWLDFGSLILCPVSGLGLTEGSKHSLVFRGFPDHAQKILEEDKFWSEEELRRDLVLENMTAHIFCML